MKEKIVKNYRYDGLGFPIQLDQVKMVKIDDDWCPKINVRKIADQVLKQLVLQETPLTGHQVRFIRSYFSMSLREFSKEIVHQSHAAVKKWEDYGDKPAKMDTNTEMILKLYVIEKIKMKTAKQKSSLFYREYKKLRDILSSNERKNTDNLRPLKGRDQGYLRVASG